MLEPQFDGVMLAEFKEEDGKLHRRLTSPYRDRVLRQNQELQRTPGALRKLESMGCELMIPEPDYYNLIEIYPELVSLDGEIQTRAWQRFLASPISDMYRTSPRVRKNGLSVAVAGASITSQL